MVTDGLNSAEGEATLFSLGEKHDLLPPGPVTAILEVTEIDPGERSVTFKQVTGIPTYAFIDVETTGFDPLRNGVLTLACYITDDQYNLVGEHYGEFRPDGKREIVWGEEAEKVHGISWDRAQSFPDMETSSRYFLEFLEKYPPCTFVAHNMAFDRRMVRGTLARNDLHFRFYRCFPRFQDTIKLVKEAGLVSSKSKSLGVICKELGIEHDHHDARSDAKVLIQIHKLCTQALSKETIMCLSEGAE